MGRTSYAGGRLKIAVGALCGALVLTTLAASPAAAEVPDSVSGPGWFAMVDGQLVDVGDRFRSHVLDLDQPAKSAPDLAPRLIDLSQWVSCYTFNMKDEVFAEYTHYWDGVGHDVRLKCGDYGTSGWGYRHIEEGHKSDWQTKLDQARAKGWNSQWQGVESWDDLMAGAAASAITWPEHVGSNAVSKTKCGITDLYLVDRNRPQVVLMVIRVAAVWATNSDRLITAYPTQKTVC